MLLCFLCVILSTLDSASAAGRIVVSTGTRDIVSMKQLEPHEKAFPYLDDIRRQIYDTLYEIDDQGVVKEGLIEKCDISSDSEDIESNVTLALNCKMHPLIYFHDGIELTSRDVIFSIDRIKKSKTLSSYLDMLVNFSAIDKYNFKFVLKYKTPDVLAPKEWLFERFKRVLAKTSYIMRARYFEGNSNWALEYPVGTGPFYFVDWKIWDKTEGRSQIILAKNRSYWRKEYPKLDQIIFRFLPVNMWSTQIKEGNLSLVLRPNARDYEIFRNQNKIQGIARESRRLTYSYQYLLFSPSSKYFQSKDLKRALLNSLNRNKLAKNALGSSAMVNKDRALYSSTVFPEKFPVLKYKPKDAREALLDYLKARTVKRKELKKDYINISILVPNRIEDLLVAEELRKQIGPIGFLLKVVKVLPENYNILVNKENFNSYDLILYSVDENPNYTTPNVRTILSYGGSQLYQRYLNYILSRPEDETTIALSTPLNKFVPPAEGAMFLMDAE